MVIDFADVWLDQCEDYYSDFKELTPRQIREHAADQARREEAREKESQPQTSRAMEVRNFYRKQAGWPALR